MREGGGDELRSNLGSLPVLDLWMPRNRVVANLPPLPEDAGGELPFPLWLFWQRSETGTVPGTSGNVDLNPFNGNAQNLANRVASIQPRL